MLSDNGSNSCLPLDLISSNQSVYVRYDLLQAENATGMTDLPVSTHPRHKAHLEDALRFLDAFLNTRKSRLPSSHL